MITLSQVLDTLVAKGWVHTPGCGAIAIKVYATAVGPREAHAYLSHEGISGRYISGHYLSEGINILAGISRLFSLDLRDLDEQRRLIELFCSDVDRYVANSYAGRLQR